MGNRTRNTVRIILLPPALRERRLRAFLSPEQLAHVSGVGLGTIKAAEGSERSVHLSTVKALAEALKCDPADISRVDVADEVAS